MEEVLSKAWYHLRLSVRHPKRVHTWDAIILTAASPEQAHLYQWQLDRAKRMERIASHTITLAVPDPQGARIGSGAATFFAIHTLIHHLARIRSPQVCSDIDIDKDPCSLAVHNLLAKMCVLVVHAGGDSKRVPWANPMGKAFIPLPYLADDDPDGPVPLLFDHILAISSSVLKQFRDKGGVFIMTGDVLPCFDSSCMVMPDDGACVVTVPATVDIAAKHGVIVTSSTKKNDKFGNETLEIVENLLQKPNLKQLFDNHAVRSDGKVLLDTGIFAVRGKAWMDMIQLSTSCLMLINDLISKKKEVSLYEEVAAAWVPAKHEWLKTCPLGSNLVNYLGDQRLFTYCAEDLLFLHFGTTSEVLDHLGEGSAGRIARRHLSSIPASTFCDLATSAVILSSEIATGVSVGDETLIFDSTLSSGVQIGSRCIVVGLHLEPRNMADAGISPLLLLPDRHCIWEVPLLGDGSRVILCCGIEDNPKTTIKSGGTFCGKVWEKIFKELGIQECDIWGHTQDPKCLWNAKLFPTLQRSENLQVIMWLMGLHSAPRDRMLKLWKQSNRVSLEEIHRNIDYQHLCSEASNHRAKLAAGIARACISYGLLGRNLSRLCAEILEGDTAGVSICKDFLTLCPDPGTRNLMNLPQSRVYQAKVDLFRACGEENKAKAVEEMVWEAVASETATAVRQDLGDQPPRFLSPTDAPTSDQNGYQIPSSETYIIKKASVRLPVRVDFAGGWSDTPPWSLERTGYVLNMAIHLDGICPVGAEIVMTSGNGVFMCDDSGNKLHINDLSSISPPFPEEDKFRLVKAALMVTQMENVLEKVVGKRALEIKTWANVPRGSGLGTSSILAAAVVKGLMQIIDGDESNENVARLVLVLEQLMGTGGGWQDQIGGLYPGIKFTTSLPGKPLRLDVENVLVNPQLVSQLEQRLLVVFTGQVRLAHQVLQKVVARYLQRDACLIKSIKQLTRLAKMGREFFINGNLDGLGAVMVEAWGLHQELDPYCSNELVDNLFEYVKPFCCGYKLVGAGGGGFALLLSKSIESAEHLKSMLMTSDFPVKVYSWRMC